GFIALFSYDSEVKSAAFSFDGKIIFIVSLDYTVRFWDVIFGAPIGVPLGYEVLVGFAMFRSDGQVVLTISLVGEVCLWDVRTGVLFHDLKGHKGDVLLGYFSRDDKV